jgi:hypothetical protein
LLDNDFQTVSRRAAAVDPSRKLGTAGNRKRIASGMIEQLVGVAAKADQRGVHHRIGSTRDFERGRSEGRR